MGDVNATTTAGIDARGYRRAGSGAGPWDQYVVPVEDKIISFDGRAATFVTPGRAAVGQKILALHNASGSAVLVEVSRITVDLLTTVAKAATVIPPVIRIQRFTVLPTGGTALAKTAQDTSGSSNASVTAWGDASADGTGSATTLTVTALGVVAQKWAPRILSAVGYEPVDTAPFFYGEPDITLRALEGVCVFLDQATVTTGNPATDRWLAEIDFREYTRP